MKSVVQTFSTGLNKVPVQSFTLLSLCCVAFMANACASLEKTIKETGDGSQLSAVSALLVANEGWLLVLDNKKGVFSEYKGKANIRYELVKNKVFQSASDAKQVIAEL